MNNDSNLMSGFSDQEYCLPEMLLEISAPLNTMIERTISVVNLL